ncbi:MAG: S8 family peptidase [Proteobacteria bacterium]|nr:S8 family peptidase [Pseudomonadota bacterium]
MLAVLLLLGTALPQLAAAQASDAQPAAQRFIVKLRQSPVGGSPEQVRSLATREGLRVLGARHVYAGMHLLQVEGGISETQALARLRADPQVEYAVVDERRHALAAPDDPLFSGQWYMQNTQASAVDAVDAWNLSTGSKGLVIAALDTGVRFEHPDLRNATDNRLLPGYDMISSVQTANDGDGRDADASDPGDWVSTEDTKTSLFKSCTVSNSSWHGTRVAGILGAITNNGSGIAGMTQSGWILPVRVLGKCGGYDSDIIAAMAWAAGLPVDGVPTNPYPARILNLSLGSTGSCPASYQQVVDQLVALGVLVVASAGNEGGPVDAPGNCAGVAAVAGLRQIGTKVGYSSLGPEIALSAPAGNCVNTGAGQPCLFSIDTTSNTGTTVPVASTYTDQSNFNIGTSFSAPIVSGIAGLMLSVNGNLTADQLIARLQLGATTPFPVNPGAPMCHVPANASDLQTAECNCTTDVCGAGMANANGAVLQALRPIAAVTLPSSVNAGGTVSLDASASAAACGATVVRYHWSADAGQTPVPVIKNPDSAIASVTAPASGMYMLSLTVTDDAGRADTAAVIVTSSHATSTAPPSAGDSACLTPVNFTVTTKPSSGGSGTPPASGGGGGGGSLDLVGLLCGLGLLLRRGARR